LTDLDQELEVLDPDKDLELFKKSKRWKYVLTLSSTAFDSLVLLTPHGLRKIYYIM
jgi:hypothetical protein